jgi:hypothetical protein
MRQAISLRAVDEQLKNLKCRSTERQMRAQAALGAALDAYDRAFGAPSVYGLPSAAAIVAYREMRPEAESVIRAELDAALRSRLVARTVADESREAIRVWRGSAHTPSDQAPPQVLRSR